MSDAAPAPMTKAEEDRIVKQLAEAFGRDYEAARQRAEDRAQQEEDTLP